MTRMERRRRRRRILRIKLATTAAVLTLTTASIVALTGGAAETVPEPTPQPPALQAEPVLLVAEHDSTYQPVQMTAEPAQEPEPVEEEDENEKIEAALLEQGYSAACGRRAKSRSTSSRNDSLHSKKSWPRFPRNCGIGNDLRRSIYVAAGIQSIILRRSSGSRGQ